MGTIDILNYDFEVGEILGISSANHFSCFEKKEFNNNTLTKHIKFVYDGFKLITEFDVLNSDELMAKYLWAEDNLLTLIKDNASYYYMVDGNKNIVGLVNESGALANHYEYTPFGKLINEVEAIENPFKFSSEYADTETGLIYYNYRYYNPATGKWLKRDPIQEQGGLNLYGFVGNNSVSYFDLFGLDVKDNTPTDYDKHPDRKPVKDPFVDASIKNGFNILRKSKARCSMPQYDTMKNNEMDGKERLYNKYDAIIVFSVFYWNNKLNLKLPKDCLCKIAKIIKAIAWQEANVGYGSGWRDSRKKWHDTEDVMQVAFEGDHTISSKINDVKRRFKIKIPKIVKIGINRKDYSNKNITGKQSVFYGVMWYLNKFKGKMQNNCDCSDITLKNAAREYNGNNYAIIEGKNKGKIYKYVYADNVWRGYKSGKQSDRHTGKTRNSKK